MADTLIETLYAIERLSSVLVNTTEVNTNTIAGTHDNDTATLDRGNFLDLTLSTYKIKYNLRPSSLVRTASIAFVRVIIRTRKGGVGDPFDLTCELFGSQGVGSGVSAPTVISSTVAADYTFDFATIASPVRAWKVSDLTELRLDVTHTQQSDAILSNAQTPGLYVEVWGTLGTIGSLSYHKTWDWFNEDIAMGSTPQPVPKVKQ